MDDVFDLRTELGRLPGRQALGGFAGGGRIGQLDEALEPSGSAAYTVLRPAIDADTGVASATATNAHRTVGDCLGAVSAELPAGTYIIVLRIAGVDVYVGRVC